MSLDSGGERKLRDISKEMLLLAIKIEDQLSTLDSVILQLDEWMEAFEEEEEAARKAASISNDDGWTVVTRRPVKFLSCIAS